MAKIRKFTEEDASQLLNQKINAKRFYISKIWDYEMSLKWKIQTYCSNF